jgi:DNA polymerase elongation subunit (family B)
MSKKTKIEYDPLLYGYRGEERLVAVEHLPHQADEQDEMKLFYRKKDNIVEETDKFEPFIFIDGSVPVEGLGEYKTRKLKGNGRLNTLLIFKNWETCNKAKERLAKKTGYTPGDVSAPYYFINDAIQQYLIASGRTLFLGMDFEDVRRMQVDIECIVTPGYEFCNPEREDDRIIAIGLSDNTGWMEIICDPRKEEKELLERFVEAVRERDPDIIEGHNIFNFDLSYLFERARRHNIKLTLGRDGSEIKMRKSRLTIAERTISYNRFDIFGRHIVDTLFLVHMYDVTHRSLDGFGLKEVAIHFGLARPDRVYLDASKITEEYKKDANRVIAYLKDDLRETKALSELMSIPYFVQTQMIPLSYQNICVRGNAVKIDALMIREYYRQGFALPEPEKAREFTGGYTDVFIKGVVKNVHHCDIRSLYPSLMLAHKITSKNDELGIFLKLLETNRKLRLEAKEKAKQSKTASKRAYYDAMQLAFKVLINSFYGYLGFAQARFNDFSSAERVATEGRTIVKTMLEWLKKHEATPVQLDTDGIYFVPPPSIMDENGNPLPERLEQFRKEFADALPEHIEIEFDGEYRTMFSYKMKNYALLSYNGEIVIKGAALKSRGLEPFQREFLKEFIRLKLECRDAEIPALKERYENAIKNHLFPIEFLAKTETLQDSVSSYKTKRDEKRRGKSAAYELAIKSGKDYKAGDQITYYVTGNKKNVIVHENVKLISEWNPLNRDENIAYYLAKLDALYKKVMNIEEEDEEDEEDKE